MPPRRFTVVAASAAALVALASGCAHDASPVRAAPSPVKSALYTPPPDKLLTSVLLDFDGPHDSTFVDAPTVTLAVDPTRPGNRTLAAQGGAVLNLTSLVRGRDFGGQWDMVGVKLWSDTATTCTVSLIEADGSAMVPRTVAAHTWTMIWMQIPNRPTATQPSGQPTEGVPETTDAVSLSIKTEPSARLLIDDVALAQSRVTACETHVPKTNENWTLKRVGTRWQAAIGGAVFYQLPAAPFVVGGYRAIESGPTRVVFTNDVGSTISLDRVGRLIENGAAKLEPGVLKVAKAIAENASPASIEIVNDEGRIERSLPGDRDNDGYDETRGCYTVHATAGRATVRFTRQRATVKWPVLEVMDLPPGPVSVWIAGEVVPWAARADDGRVVVELPVELQTPIEVQIRVK